MIAHKIAITGVGEIAQGFRDLIVFAEDSGFTFQHPHGRPQPLPSSDLHKHHTAFGAQTHMQKKHTCTYADMFNIYLYNFKMQITFALAVHSYKQMACAFIFS